jgi:hypothetical protein
VKEGGGGVLGHGREGAAGEKGCRAVVRPFYRRGGRAVTGKGNGGWRGVPRCGVMQGRGAWFRLAVDVSTDSGPAAAHRWRGGCPNSGA